MTVYPSTDSRSDRNNAAVLIIGGGISGICMAIDMIRRNDSRDFIIVEKGSQVGGTWADNRYPGCCCDIWSHLYSYSFEPNPNWTREYPGQEEIHAYLVAVAMKWGLYQHIRFNTTVEEARWNEAANHWETSVKVTGAKDAEYAQTYSITSAVLISAVGQLNVPQYPTIQGIDAFQGKMMHSARWDRNYQYEGKNIAVIGNGATAAQIIPELAKTAKSVTVFQRTPNWIVPRGDKPISEAMRKVYRYVPATRRRYRASLMDMRESFFDAAAVENSQMNTIIRQLSLDTLSRQIPKDEDLRKALTPSYPPGCKRIIISDDFFPAMNQPNVTLETNPIERMTPTGISTGAKHYDFDLIVLATGFRTTEFMYPIKVVGIGGRPIADIWNGGARAYLGMTVESLPNFSMFYGPNTNLGHNSIILMIEAQSRYTNTLISPILKARAQGARLSILPTPERLDSYNTEIQGRLQKSTFSHPSCRSWYKTAEGLVTNNWCGTVVEYQVRTSAVEWSHFILSGDGKELVRCKKRSEIGRVVEETHPSLLGLVGSIFTGVLIVAGAVYRRVVGKVASAPNRSEP